MDNLLWTPQPKTEIISGGDFKEKHNDFNGAESRTRTGTRSLAPDFESGVSTSFTTSAGDIYLTLPLGAGTDRLSHRESRQYHGCEGA